MFPIKYCLPNRSHHGECWKTMAINKEHLKEDFNHKCAYCDDHDWYYGGSDNYHVDHFAPKAKFKHLEYNYDNLLYACPFCNRAKSDKWVGRDESETIVGDCGFIDPCTPEYLKHLERNKNGEIVPKSDIGNYMYKELKLYLDRHRICFIIEQIAEKRKQLKSKCDELIASGNDASKLETAYHEVNEALCNYYEILHNINS